jgi:tetratricopeptide (TPR) repeat protein
MIAIIYTVAIYKRSFIMATINHNIQELIKQKKYIDALAILMPKYNERRVQESRFYYIVGNCFYEIHDTDNAIKFFKMAIELYDEDVEYFIKLAIAYEKKNDAISAIKAYMDAMELKPDDIELNERFNKLVERYTALTPNY